MNPYARAIKRHHAHTYTHHAFALQTFENTVEYAVFAPTVHAGVNGVPAAEFLVKGAPFAPVFKDMKDAIEDFQILV